MAFSMNWRNWSAQAEAHDDPRLQMNLSLVAERKHTRFQRIVRRTIHVDESLHCCIPVKRLHRKRDRTHIEVRVFARSRRRQRNMPRMENLGKVAA